MCISLRASGAAGPQSSYHRPLHYSSHLENHSVLSRVPPGVEGGGRSDVHVTFTLKHSLVPFCPLFVLALKHATVLRLPVQHGDFIIMIT